MRVYTIIISSKPLSRSDWLAILTCFRDSNLIAVTNGFVEKTHLRALKENDIKISSDDTQLIFGYEISRRFDEKLTEAHRDIKLDRGKPVKGLELDYKENIEDTVQACAAGIGIDTIISSVSFFDDILSCQNWMKNNWKYDSNRET